MLHDPARHESLDDVAWDAEAARDAIARIVRGAEEGFIEGRGWPLHPNDSKNPAPVSGLYFGDSGFIWALRYLQRRGAARLSRDWLAHLAGLRVDSDQGSYLFGETPMLMMLPGHDDRLAAHIEGTMHHAARELMWGAPGAMLAALFLHRRMGDGPWADLYRRVNLFRPRATRDGAVGSARHQWDPTLLKQSAKESATTTGSTTSRWCSASPAR